MITVYKIETYSDECAAQIANYIEKNNGYCSIQGWAIITDYCFRSPKSLELLPFISTITAELSESDIYYVRSQSLIAA
ncbi:hypothetical protein L3Q72_05695 [Vibrio sp. JC009]|uniref:hypothetical protein n=1 Tax=Vibrio sp. JC009 TaxID=2912314 RepID=UPI0023B17DD5|nr:hypothetical protein [Vibrio sp. JC009]WED22886.1 hypothetical protein L3Q72_05695 [Vibrio sp. JC009]